MQRSIPYLWVLVIILLILNLLFLDLLNLARLAAVDGLSRLEVTLDALASEVIVYNIDVHEAVPLKADIPIDRTIEVPISITVPIDEVLTVPVQTAAGEIILSVPIKTEFPVDTVIPLELKETFVVDTMFQLDTTLPIEIDVATTLLAGYLRQANSQVGQLKRRLSLKPRGEEVADETVDDREISGAEAALTASDSTSADASVETEAGMLVS